MAFKNFDGNDNWKWQLRGNDGRWINMYGPVIFDYTPKGGGPAKKGHGTFQGVTSPGRANIFVKDDPELEVGLYEVQSKYITGVKALIPTDAGEDKPIAKMPVSESVEAPKGREVSSREMQKEFDVTKDASDLKDDVAKNLLRRILAKGITKDQLVETLLSMQRAKVKEKLISDTGGVEPSKWSAITGIVKWEGTKDIKDIPASSIKTLISGGKEVQTIQSGGLGVALRNAMSFYKIDSKKDDVPPLNDSMTYDEAIAFIKKLNSLIDYKYKNDKDYNTRHEFVFEDNIESAKEVISYSAVANMISEWAGSSNDENAFSLALQETVAKLFNFDNYLPWTTTKKASEDRDALIKLHEKVIRAYAEAQYESTQEELKAKGITSVQLFRGMKDSSLRETLDEYGYLDDSLVILRPLSSFSYDIRTAEGFSGESADKVALTYEQLETNPEALLDFIEEAEYNVPETNLVLKPNEYLDIYGEVKQFEGVVLNTTVPADKIFSIPFTGVGCLNESEVVVLGPNLRAEVIRPVDAETLANEYDLYEEEED